MKSVFVFFLVLFCTLAQSHAQVACRELELPVGASSRTEEYCFGSKEFNEELSYAGEEFETECCQDINECDPTGLRDNGMFYFNYCVNIDEFGFPSDCDCRSILAAAIPDLKSALESDTNFDGNCET